MTEKISPNHRQETFSKCTILLKSCRHRLLARRRRQTKPNRTEDHFLQCVPSCNIGVITLLGGIINQIHAFQTAFLSRGWLPLLNEHGRNMFLKPQSFPIVNHQRPPRSSTLTSTTVPSRVTRQAKAAITLITLPVPLVSCSRPLHLCCIMCWKLHRKGLEAPRWTSSFAETRWRWGRGWAVRFTILAIKNVSFRSEMRKKEGSRENCHRINRWTLPAGQREDTEKQQSLSVLMIQHP